jgi:hypothetical protein
MAGPQGGALAAQICRSRGEIRTATILHAPLDHVEGSMQVPGAIALVFDFCRASRRICRYSYPDQRDGQNHNQDYRDSYGYLV